MSAPEINGRSPSFSNNNEQQRHPSDLTQNQHFINVNSACHVRTRKLPLVLIVIDENASSMIWRRVASNWRRIDQQETTEGHVDVGHRMTGFDSNGNVQLHSSFLSCHWSFVSWACDFWLFEKESLFKRTSMPVVPLTFQGTFSTRSGEGRICVASRNQSLFNRSCRGGTN